MKKFIALVLIALMALFLCGCQNKDAEPISSPGVDFPEDMTGDEIVVKFNLIEDCNMVALRKYNSYAEYAEENDTDILKDGLAVTGIPYDGCVYAYYSDGIISGFYSSKELPDYKLLNGFMGFQFREGDLEEFADRGYGQYWDMDTDTMLEYTADGWYLYRSFGVSPVRIPEGVS